MAGYQGQTGNFKWKLADGRVVSMHDMTTLHLTHAIARIESQKAQNGKLTQLKQVLATREPQPQPRK